MGDVLGNRTDHSSSLPMQLTNAASRPTQAKYDIVVTSPAGTRVYEEHGVPESK